MTGRINYIFTAIFSLFSVVLPAQQHRCFTEQLHQQKLKDDPAYNSRYQSQHETVFSNDNKRYSATDTTVLIPVVVHVIRYNGIGC